MHLVDLLPINDAQRLPMQVAAQLGIATNDDDGSAAIASRFRGGRTLLIFDNCEHLIGEAAALVGALLSRLPSLTVMATSREALAISGELAFRLPPMDIRAASQLFVARAQTSDLAWSIDEQRLAIVDDICRRLDCIPLAIELTASRVSTLGIETLRGRLKNVVSSDARDLPARHQTMVATIAWSYDLLGDEERALFRRASVAMTAFTLDSAEEICSDDALPVAKVADVLSRLVAKSLINVEHDGTATCYRYLDSIRAFARERLKESGEQGMVMRQAMAWLKRRAMSLIDLPLSPAIVPEYRAELNNARAAIRWGILSDDATMIESASDILIGYARVFVWANRQSEARQLGLELLGLLDEVQNPERIAQIVHSIAAVVTRAEFEDLVPRAIPVLERMGELDRAASLYARTAIIDFTHGAFDLAKEHVANAAALMVTPQCWSSRSGLTTATSCAYVLSLLGDYSEATTWIQRMNIPPGDPFEIESQIVLAEIEFSQGHVENALGISKRSLAELYRYPDLNHISAMVFGNGGKYHLHLGEMGPAGEAIREAIRREVDTPDLGYLFLASALGGYAAVFAARGGNAELAARLLGSCDAVEKHARPAYRDTYARGLATELISAMLPFERIALLRARGAGEDLYEVLEEFLAQPAAEVESALLSAMSSS
jgi:predicted ATPase